MADKDACDIARELLQALGCVCSNPGNPGPVKEPWIGTVIESTTKPSAKRLQGLLPNHVRSAQFEVRRLPKEQYALPSWEVKWKATEMEPGWAVVAKEGSISIEPSIPIWQTKQADYVRLYYPKAEGKGAFPSLEQQHQAAVRQALSEGKPVPAEVLKDYPYLAGVEL